MSHDGTPTTASSAPEDSRRLGVAGRAGLGAIRGYQKVLSPVMGGNCRYYPSCSHYTYEAIEIHGLARGSWLGIKRIGRCHPWHEGGFDPVPGSEADVPADFQGGEA